MQDMEDLLSVAAQPLARRAIELLAIFQDDSYRLLGRSVGQVLSGATPTRGAGGVRN